MSFCSFGFNFTDFLFSTRRRFFFFNDLHFTKAPEKNEAVSDVTVSVEQRVCISRTTTEVKCLLWPHGGSWEFRTEHHVQTHTKHTHTFSGTNKHDLPCNSHIELSSVLQFSNQWRLNSNILTSVYYRHVKKKRYCMCSTLTDILFERVLCGERRVLLFAERHWCVLRGR